MNSSPYSVKEFRRSKKVNGRFWPTPPHDVNGPVVRVAGVRRPIVPNKLGATNTSRALTEDWSCQPATNVMPR